MEDVIRLKRESVYQGHLFEYFHDTMKFSNGNTAIWDHIEHKGAAAVVPVQADGTILMVRQYRNSVGRETLEIPAGGLESKDEPTLEAALRELEEETGYKAGKAEYLVSTLAAPAYCSEKVDIYVAMDLIPSRQHLDENEFVELESYTVDVLCEKIFAGEICDSKTVAAIMAYARKYHV